MSNVIQPVDQFFKTSVQKRVEKALGVRVEVCISKHVSQILGGESYNVKTKAYKGNIVLHCALRDFEPLDSAINTAIYRTKDLIETSDLLSIDRPMSTGSFLRDQLKHIDNYYDYSFYDYLYTSDVDNILDDIFSKSTSIKDCFSFLNNIDFVKLEDEVNKREEADLPF